MSLACSAAFEMAGNTVAVAADPPDVGPEAGRCRQNDVDLVDRHAGFVETTCAKNSVGAGADILAGAAHARRPVDQQADANVSAAAAARPVQVLYPSRESHRCFASSRSLGLRLLQPNRRWRPTGIRAGACSTTDDPSPHLACIVLQANSSGSMLRATASSSMADSTRKARAWCPGRASA